MVQLSTRAPVWVAFSVGAALLSYGLRHAYLRTTHYTLIDEVGRYADVLILGGGHAGLSGALTLTRHQHDVIIFDDDSPRNRWNTPVHVLPTWEHQQPRKLRESSRRELQSSGLVTFVDERIVEVVKEHDSLFHATGSSGKVWTGRKLLLAMGAEFLYPSIPGYAENFPERM